MQINTGIPVSEQPPLNAENDVQHVERLVKESDKISAANKSEPEIMDLITRGSTSPPNDSISSFITTKNPENSTPPIEKTEGLVGEITDHNATSVLSSIGNLTDNQTPGNDTDLKNGTDEATTAVLDYHTTGRINDSAVSNITQSSYDSTSVLTDESTYIPPEEILVTTGDRNMLISSKSFPGHIEVTTEATEHFNLKSTKKAKLTALPTLKEIIIIEPTPDPHKQQIKGGKDILKEGLLGVTLVECKTRVLALLGSKTIFYAPTTKIFFSFILSVMRSR